VTGVPLRRRLHFAHRDERCQLLETDISTLPTSYRRCRRRPPSQRVGPDATRTSVICPHVLSRPRTSSLRRCRSARTGRRVVTARYRVVGFGPEGQLGQKAEGERRAASHNPPGVPVTGPPKTTRLRSQDRRARPAPPESMTAKSPNFSLVDQPRHPTDDARNWTRGPGLALRNTVPAAGSQISTMDSRVRPLPQLRSCARAAIVNGPAVTRSGRDASLRGSDHRQLRRRPSVVVRGLAARTLGTDTGVRHSTSPQPSRARAGPTRLRPHSLRQRRTVA